MAETYLAIVDCYYASPGFNRKRFKPGDELPEGWEPCQHFLPQSEAKREIQRRKYMELGIAPDRERALRASQQKRNYEIKNTIDMDEAAQLLTEPQHKAKTSTSGVDFLTLPPNTELKKEVISKALQDQFGLNLNYKIIKKEDLVTAGREAARRAQ